jgi:hypothetical protein
VTGVIVMYLIVMLQFKSASNLAIGNKDGYMSYDPTEHPEFNETKAIY